MSNIFSGLVRIGSDPELRFIPSGKAVLTFSAASSTGFGDKQKTLWVRATCWNKAEKMKEFLVKGNQISITGELSQTEYQAKDGSTKTSLDLNVHSIDLVGKKSEGGQQQAPQPRQAPAPANDLPYDDFDDQIPF
jgi:single-strand DNA-binding protein